MGDPLCAAPDQFLAAEARGNKTAVLLGSEA